MAFQVEGWSSKVLVTLVAALIGWTAFENVQSYAFRAAGGRCTTARCNWIEKIVDELKDEDRRLQLQIDNIRGLTMALDLEIPE